MRPCTRHFVRTDLIFNAFRLNFTDYVEFATINGNAIWKSMGGVIFSKKMYLPGAFHLDAPYQLKDAVALGSFVFGPSRVLGTRSAVLFHYNYPL